MKTGLFIVGLLICGLVALPGTAAAVTYKYTDKAGILCFADDLQVIPDQYRSQAVLIEGELKEASTASAGSALSAAMVVPTAEQQQAASHSFFFRSLSLRLLITVCVGLAMAALVAAVSRQLAGEEQQRVRSFTKKGALAVFLVYLIFAHGRDILTVVRTADRTVYEVQQRSVRKGQKAAEGIKRLDGLFEEMQKAEESYKREEETNNR